MGFLDFALVPVDASSDQEGENDLVRLKQTSRHIGVNHLGNVLNKKVCSLSSSTLAFLLFSIAELNRRLDIDQGVLVHRIDAS